MSTPGIIGLSGKCPGKKLSLMVTFLIATADTPALYSITLSTNKNGNLQNNPKSDQNNTTSANKQCAMKFSPVRQNLLYLIDVHHRWKRLVP